MYRLRRKGLATAFPVATPRLAVFVHGLSETEPFWQPAPISGGISFGDRLAAEFGYRPVYVLYNTGRRHSRGRRPRVLRTSMSWPVSAAYATARCTMLPLPV
jgi:hypothetical protein